MPKKKTKQSTSAKDARLKKKRLSAIRRSHANPLNFPIDFGPMPPGPMDPQVLAEHLPAPPAHTHLDLSDGTGRSLPQSPAHTWLELSTTEIGAGAIEMIERWPFRIVQAGHEVSPEKGWTCLRLLALGTNETVESICTSLAKLEDASLQYWHPNTNAYVLPEDTPNTRGMSPAEALAAVDEFTEARAQEPAARKAARKWAKVAVTSSKSSENDTP